MFRGGTVRDAARGLAGPFVERMVVGAARARGELPRPWGDPRVHAMGPDPDRILLVGAGIVRGLGVASHELGLGGHLARRLSALTGRGADIELVGVPSLTVTAARRLVDGLQLERYDAVVLMLGAREAIGLRNPVVWERDLLDLVTTVRERGVPALPVFLVSIAPPPSVVPFDGVIAPVVTRHVARLNAVLDRLGALPGVHVIPFEPGDALGNNGLADTATYAAWSRPIATGMHAVLDDAVPVRPAGVTDEQLRQASLDAMGILDDPPSAELEALSRVARDLFGVDGAAVNLIDHDRQLSKSAQGFPRGEIPRSESLCATTVEQDGILVVEDAQRDARFSAMPSVAGGVVRFYAGHPVEAPDGQRVGTLCLFDAEPRPFTSADRSLLRELALRVQAELWSHVRVSAR